MRAAPAPEDGERVDAGDSATRVAGVVPGGQQDASGAETSERPGVDVDADDVDGAAKVDDVPMAGDDNSAGSAAAKRKRDDDCTDTTVLQQMEPPSKTVPLWR